MEGKEKNRKEEEGEGKKAEGGDADGELMDQGRAQDVEVVVFAEGPMDSSVGVVWQLIVGADQLNDCLVRAQMMPELVCM